MAYPTPVRPNPTRAAPALLAAATALLLAAAALGAGRDAADAERLWVDVSVPLRVEGPVPWLELRGVAGRADALHHDVVVAIDVSGSTAVASGADVDGDGHRGRRLASADDPLRSANPRRLCSDPDDTVLRAEIEGTRRLLAELASPGTRVGLLAFAGRAWTLAPLGASRESLEAALSRLAGEARPGGGTNLARALEAGVAMLEATPRPDGVVPARSLVLLSDGNPSEPAPTARAEEAALAAAGELARTRTRLRAFALGIDALAESDVLARIAGATDGTVRRLASAGEVVDALPRLRLVGATKVEVRNETLGEPARAVRLFADGSFDAIVPLTPGRNDVRVTARGQGAAPVVVERLVHYTERPPLDPAAAQAAERWLERLRLRTVETEMALRPTRGGAGAEDQERQVEVDAASPGLEDSGTP